MAAMHKSLVFLVASSVLACSSSSGDVTPGGDSGPPVDSTVDLGTDAGCSVPFADPQADKRTACTFKAGDKPSDTVGDFTTAKSKIGHVVVMMKENRSFDMILGELSKTVNGVEPRPADYNNPDTTGASVAPFHQTSTCFELDPEHQWDNQHANWDNGKNDGFVKNASANSSDALGRPATTDGHFVMGYYDASDLPFYYWLASNYAVADHYFCAALSGTWSNRLFLYAGSSYGVKVTGGPPVPATAKGHTLFDALDTAKVDWAIYSDDAEPLDFAMFTIGFDSTNPKVHKTADFFSAASAGTLPTVVFIDALENKEDEHPPADVQVGEAWSKKVYDAVTASPNWLGTDGKGTALFYTYDENGSYADHFPPPNACAPSTDLPEWDHLGFRVPFVLVSPYAKKKFVSHDVHTHTSITRFIEGLFDVPALTARDANSDALLDMFDFGCPSSTPSGAPSAGTGGCGTTTVDAGVDAPSDGG
jgi:phospholipase C